MGDEYKKDSRPGPVRVLAGGSGVEAPFRSLKLSSGAAGLTTVTIISGGEQVALPMSPGELIQATGTEIISTSPSSDVIYWIL